MTQIDHASERERIMTVAYELLAASAGTSVSVTDILARAGLSTRAFYRHFESRDALLTAMFRQDSERVVATVRARAAAAPNGRAALEIWISEMLAVSDNPRRRRRALVLTSQEVTRAQGYRAERLTYLAAQDAALTEILEAGRADGSLPLARPGTDAAYIRAALDGALSERMIRSSPPETAEATESLLDFVLRALNGPGWKEPDR